MCECVWGREQGTDLVCKGPEIAVAAGNAHLFVVRESRADEELLGGGLESGGE